MKQYQLISFCFATFLTAPLFAASTTSHSPTAKTNPENFAQVDNARHTITAWEISGVMAARNRNKNWSASVNWLQRGPNQYQIRLFGPLGGGAILIQKRGGVISYTDGPKKITAQSADRLLEQQTGIRLPVQNLYYWVRGLPAPGAIQNSHYDNNRHLASFSQNGYNIRYPSYVFVKNKLLPSKIYLQGHGVSIRMAIKQWKV